MPDTAVEFTEYRQLDALPPEALALFDQESPFSTLAWYRAVTAHALPPDAVPAFLVARLNGRILAVFPMQRGPGNTLGSLAPPYTSLWQPLICEAAAHDPESLLLIGRSFASICRRLATVRLEAMDASSLDLPKLMAGLRAGGILPLRFDNFGNWHQPLEQGWAGYLAARPSALYETIRRRTKRLAGDPGVCFSLVEGVANLDQAIADYGAIYAASWKQPEPFENFIAGYVREAATENTLRLFLLHLNATPIAAQIWIVQARVGHLLKLAHLESHRALSPGTVLTAHAIQQLMQRDNIAHLDFGRGDDAYKRLWASERRQRIGLLLANPSTILGISKIARHVAGSLRRRVLQLRSP